MRIDFLGTGAGNYRGSQRLPSSALLGGLLLDCGAGATGRLHDLGRFDAVEAVLISHLHTDHVAGLPDLLLHTLITHRRRPLTIFSPPGLGKILRAVFDVHGTVIDPSELYEFHLLEGEAFDARVGPWRVQTRSLDHTVPNLGYLVSTDDVSVFYTGDTREPCAGTELHADYLVHEATFCDRHVAQAKEYGHSTGTEAGEAARRMNVRRLFVNHIGDEPNSTEEIAREAHRAFPDSTVVEDRQGFEL